MRMKYGKRDLSLSSSLDAEVEKTAMSCRPRQINANACSCIRIYDRVSDWSRFTPPESLRVFFLTVCLVVSGLSVAMSPASSCPKGDRLGHAPHPTYAPR